MIKLKPLSKKVVALIASGASAAIIGSQFINEVEGNRLKSYKDGKGIWTICQGVTHGVGPYMRMTEEECDELNRITWSNAEKDLREIAPNVNLTEAQRAGIVSFCTYNIGRKKCESSTFLKMLNRGDQPGACKQILRWIHDGGRDCRTDPSCRGQPGRREQECQLCKGNKSSL